MAKYKIGTRVKCFIGFEPTEVIGTICDGSILQRDVNMQGNSYIEFDKPVKMGVHLISRATLSNRQVERIGK